MPFTTELPEWKAVGSKPPQAVIDGGWIAGDKPPAGWWNYFQNRTYLALQELQQKAVEAGDVVLKTEKGAANGIATLGADGKVPAEQLNVSSSADKITVADAGNYFTATHAEGALQEIGQVLNGTRGSLITSANTILGS